jgi:hypothetical protein
MSFEEMLSTPRAADIAAAERDLPKAWRAGRETREDGSVAIVTGLLPATEGAVDAYLEESGFDPEHWMFKPGTGVLSKDWDTLRKVWNEEREQLETIVQPMRSSRIEVVPRGVRVNIDELMALVKEQLPAGPSLVWGDDEEPAPGVFGVALGDLQLGKVDGDGPEGTVRRFKAYVDKAVTRYLASGLADVHIAFLGDCLEGMVSQGGRNAWRTSLTTTEQVRLLRRLMLWAIDRFVDAGAERITVVSIPGNHDEAQREPVSTRSDDSWAIDALVAVSDAMELNPDRYGHVECFVPGKDEMDVTLELAGLVVTHNHGHQYLKGGDHKKAAFTWWEGQKFSDQPAGMADLMLCAHGHHYQVGERSGKTWCMVPALEELSVWWLHKTGQVGDPGIVTFEVVDGVLENLSRLRLSKAHQEA